jgi:putative membrane protein
MLRLALAWLHLLALGFGLGAVLDRAATLRGPMTTLSLRRVFRADTVWGLSALLWISTGLWRLIAGTEKATSYYMTNHVFWAKMGLLVLILLLELWPMITLIRWRIAASRGAPAEVFARSSAARRIATISRFEALLVVLMVLAATAMARGYGAR